MNPLRLLAITAVALVVGAGTAVACPVCQGGQTVPTTAAETTVFEPGVRSSVEVTWQAIDAGEGNTRRQLDDLRTLVGVGLSPLAWLDVDLRLPVIWRQMTDANLTRTTTLGLGDLNTSVALRLADDTWHVAGLLGVRLPTGAELTDETGAALDPDVQPGTGAFVPWLGVDAGLRGSWGRAFARASGWLGTEGRFGRQPGHALLATLGARASLWDVLEPGLAVDLRHEGAERVDGEVDPDHGGTVLYLSPSVGWQPLAWWTLRATVRVPVVEVLAGAQDEHALLSLSSAFAWAW